MAKRKRDDWPTCTKPVRSRTAPLVTHTCGRNAVRFRKVGKDVLYRCGVHSKYPADWRDVE